MEIRIKSLPQFEFQITLEQIRTLKKLAKLHYDGECQRAAMGISDYGKYTKPGDHQGAHFRNGLLVVWEMHFDYATKDDLKKGLWVTVNHSELDLLCKITEIWVANNAPTNGDKEFAMRFRSALSQAWHVAQKTVPTWTTTIDAL